MPHQGPYVQPGDTLEGFLKYFWQCQIATAEQDEPDFKHPPLPLARIKKVMKNDPEVKVSDRIFIFDCIEVLTMQS
jgi:nuclear transcription factor Y gamma